METSSETYRVNIRIRKDTFIELFGKIPERPGKGGIVYLIKNRK